AYQSALLALRHAHLYPCAQPPQALWVRWLFGLTLFLTLLVLNERHPAVAANRDKRYRHIQYLMQNVAQYALPKKERAVPLAPPSSIYSFNYLFTSSSIYCALAFCSAVPSRRISFNLSLHS